MKKTFALTLAALSVFCIAGTAYAQSRIPSVSPYTKSPAVQPPGDKQATQRLDDCETQFQQQNLPESQRHSFLNSCVQNKLSSSTPSSPAPSSMQAPSAPVAPSGTQSKE